MSGFRMTIEMRQAEWEAMSPEKQKSLQQLVDETFDPGPKQFRTDTQFDHDLANAEGWGNQIQIHQGSSHDKI